MRAAMVACVLVAACNADNDALSLLQAHVTIDEEKEAGLDPTPYPAPISSYPNVCEGKKPASGYDDMQCITDGVVQAHEQAGTDVTLNYNGQLATDAIPILSTFQEAGLCPVNVHWHLGTEHRSAGQFDEDGSTPSTAEEATDHSAVLLAGHDVTRQGLKCHLYDSNDPKFNTPYEWKHCPNTRVGETYEIHWPHSVAGACGTPNQYQTPFYDGVFCRDVITDTASQIGVHAQVFTIINDEDYYYPDLIRGMVVDGEYGKDIAKYTGSTTGTSRNNEKCSAYSPITWHVDRKCQLISASSFDKMCADMMAQRDDLSGDMHVHGARELVTDALASNNHQ